MIDVVGQECEGGVPCPVLVVGLLSARRAQHIVRRLLAGVGPRARWRVTSCKSRCLLDMLRWGDSGALSDLPALPGLLGDPSL